MNKASKKSGVNNSQEGKGTFEKLTSAMMSDTDVTSMRMFGSDGLKVKGKVFVFEWKGRLVLKLSKERCAQIFASKKGIYFDPGHGRISKEWVAVTPSTQDEWLKLAQEAKDFVIKVNK